MYKYGCVMDSLRARVHMYTYMYMYVHGMKCVLHVCTDVYRYVFDPSLLEENHEKNKCKG